MNFARNVARHMARSMALMMAAVIALLIIAAPVGPAHSGEKPFTEEQEDAIGELVRAYLLEHPEVLPEAIQILQQREEEAMKVAMREAIATNHQRLVNDGISPVLGNPNGDVTIVEFYDYQCPYCRRSHKDLLRLIADDPNLRVVYKQFPIKDAPGEEPGSLIASRIAIAAAKQGKFLAFHSAAMTIPMPLTEASLYKAAQKTGLNMLLLQTELNSPLITNSIRDNMLLAREIGVNATPTYVVGGDIVIGAHGYDALKATVAAERAKKK